MCSVVRDKSVVLLQSLWRILSSYQHYFPSSLFPFRLLRKLIQAKKFVAFLFVLQTELTIMEKKTKGL